MLRPGRSCRLLWIITAVKIPWLDKGGPRGPGNSRRCLIQFPVYCALHIFVKIARFSKIATWLVPAPNNAFMSLTDGYNSPTWTKSNLYTCMTSIKGNYMTLCQILSESAQILPEYGWFPQNMAESGFLHAVQNLRELGQLSHLLMTLAQRQNQSLTDFSQILASFRQNLAFVPSQAELPPSHGHSRSS